MDQMYKKLAILISFTSILVLQFTKIDVHENIEDKQLFKIIKIVSFGLAKFVSKDYFIKKNMMN